MNGTVRRIRYQRWQFMILVDNPWRSPMSASHLNFWKLLFQHLHLMASACKKLQNMQAWNHYESLLQQLGSYLFQRTYMTSHDKPDPSTGLKEKNWKAMRKPDFCINIHQSIPWTDKSPRLLLSLCFCSPQPFCFLCLLCCIWCSSLLLPNHLNTAKELQRGFALRGIHTSWTHSLQFSNFVFELLNLKQGQNKPNVTKFVWTWVRNDQPREKHQQTVSV